MYKFSLRHSVWKITNSCIKTSLNGSNNLFCCDTFLKIHIIVTSSNRLNCCTVSLPPYPSFPNQINMLLSTRKASVSQCLVNIERYAKEQDRVLRNMYWAKMVMSAGISQIYLKIHYEIFLRRLFSTLISNYFGLSLILNKEHSLL